MTTASTTTSMVVEMMLMMMVLTATFIADEYLWIKSLLKTKFSFHPSAVTQYYRSKSIQWTSDRTTRINFVSINCTPNTSIGRNPKTGRNKKKSLFVVRSLFYPAHRSVGARRQFITYLFIFCSAIPYSSVPVQYLLPMKKHTNSDLLIFSLALVLVVFSFSIQNTKYNK